MLAWIGRADLRAPAEDATAGVGPIAQALEVRSFDRAYLLADYPEATVRPYLVWLRRRTNVAVEVVYERLSGPTEFGEIYEAAVRGVRRALDDDTDPTALTFHLSPGTPAMASIWIILGKTRFPAELIESSREQGVRTASVPFDISADFIPDLLRHQDERLRLGSAAEPPTAPEFADIVYRSRDMARLVQLARRVAPRSVPVLIEGESGTGKELFARAIHRASPRRERPFVAVNCGAIPAELVESELFGHEKGAFTGATASRKGCFEEASGGTLFLDELGELPGPAQVKLLRVIQEGEVIRVGGNRPVKVDVRIVAATNRTLTDEIAVGRFREDLFYRLAVAVLKIPPLRERGGDLSLLIGHLLEQVNREAASEPGYREKHLSASAKNILLGHAWPGNVRELLNTLRRAAIWSDGATISSEEARAALLPMAPRAGQNLLDRPLGEGFDIQGTMDEVARLYLRRAMEAAKGNKTKAAELVGLPSYQTLTNWLKRLEVMD